MNNNILTFFIDEGKRSKIDNLKYEIEDEDLIKYTRDLRDELNTKIKKNNNFYSKDLINEYLELFNFNLLSNNINNKIIDVNISYNKDLIDIILYSTLINPVIVNKINISGNTITKNETIRSKLSIEPGEYLNKYKLDNTIKNLKDTLT